MRAPVIAALLVLASCGGSAADGNAAGTAGTARRADPSGRADSARSLSPASPTSANTARPLVPVVSPAPAAAPTGPSIRVTDGNAVVALDPATGGPRATWPAAAISLEGNWTVVDDGGAASWIDAYGVRDRSAAIPAGLHPTITDPSGRYVVFAAQAPPVAEGEIGPARSTSRFAVSDGQGWFQEFTLDGNFAPEAFGWVDEQSQRPMSLQLIEYLPPDHPTRYRVRSMDLVTGAVGLPVNLRDKATPVDESMAGTSRTQVYAASTAMLYTLYQPAPLDPAHPYDTWEYGFVHTLATPFAGVWCIDLPEELALTGHQGTLALSPTEQSLYVVTSAGRLGVINTMADPPAVYRTADLGVTADGDTPPAMVAGSDHLWITLGNQLLVVDPISLDVQAQAELPAPVTALTLDGPTRQLLAADGQQLRRWTLDGAGQVTAVGALPLPAGLGPIARIAT